jgi:excinuclease UvrABC ATPase subunit
VTAIERGAGNTVRQTFTRTGGMCPRCEGRGSVTDFDLSQLFDDSKSPGEGALTIPGYSVDGWYGRIFSASSSLDPDKPIPKYTRPSSTICSTRGRPRSRSTTST